MKTRHITLCLIFAVSLILPLGSWRPALAKPLLSPYPQTLKGDRLVIGETFVLQSGETLEGDLVIIGGTAEVQKGATVNGDIDLLGGSLKLAGEVVASINAVGATLEFEEGALIRGDIHAMACSISGLEKVTLMGSLNTFSPSTGVWRAPVFRWQPWANVPTEPFNFLQRAFLNLLRTLAIALLALLIALILPMPLDRISQTLTYEPFLSGGLGLLTLLVIPAVLVILLITIILIPVALAGLMILALALLLGWVAVGYEIGNRLANLFKSIWSPPVTAGIGTLILGLVLYLLGYVPCLGGILSFLIGCWGLGAVLLSRFGTQVFRTNTPVPSAPDYPGITPTRLSPSDEEEKEGENP
ncbi:polymer-forming cytoskeletal protein [uncultured Thermanaerothrix sp.]|uniref:polymer-forming cytoskeletal protein n=1 Tax=uncultured Thermanaerothrix sp. TaxID=1195149 RepID=UPI002617180A|nr:polymer-forming cytoskeletal protein [uncultured Thermanaerothrix sp.]